jgi:hypothetical protein
MATSNYWQPWFNTNVRLSIPSIKNCCYNNLKYDKKTILDYPTFFIKELFEGYDSEYNLVEETNYIPYYRSIEISFSDIKNATAIIN